MVWTDFPELVNVKSWKKKKTVKRSVVGEVSLRKRLPYNELKEEEQDKGTARVASGTKTSSAPLLAHKHIQAGWAYREASRLNLRQQNTFVCIRNVMFFPVIRRRSSVWKLQTARQVTNGACCWCNKKKLLGYGKTPRKYETKRLQNKPRQGSRSEKRTWLLQDKTRAIKLR